jgi:hypothetical protein
MQAVEEKYKYLFNQIKTKSQHKVSDQGVRIVY